MDENRTASMSQEELILEAMKHPHPKAFTPMNIVVLILTGIIGSIIGMEIMCNLGSAPNTSIIGALIAVLISFLPFKFARPFKNIHTQNLVETGISASTFGAANCMLYAMAVMWLLGLKEYMVPMIIGTAIVAAKIANNCWNAKTINCPNLGLSSTSKTKFIFYPPVIN